MPHLGLCQAENGKCLGTLGVMEVPRFRMVDGIHQIFLDAEGRDIPNDPSGHPKRYPATDWKVGCPKCGTLVPNHAYQSELDAAIAKNKSRQISPPAFMAGRLTSAAEVEEALRVDAKTGTELGPRIAEIEKRLAVLEEQIASMREK